MPINNTISYDPCTTFTVLFTRLTPSKHKRAENGKQLQCIFEHDSLEVATKRQILFSNCALTFKSLLFKTSSYECGTKCSGNRKTEVRCNDQPFLSPSPHYF